MLLDMHAARKEKGAVARPQLLLLFLCTSVRPHLVSPLQHFPASESPSATE